MTKVLSGRCALVTGAGQGVGQGIARAFAAAGANLLLAQRREADGERAEQDIGPIATFLASEASGFINGNTVFADGGSHINGVSWRPSVAD